MHHRPGLRLGQREPGTLRLDLHPGQLGWPRLSPLDPEPDQPGQVVGLARGRDEGIHQALAVGDQDEEAAQPEEHLLPDERGLLLGLARGGTGGVQPGTPGAQPFERHRDPEGPLRLPDGAVGRPALAGGHLQPWIGDLPHGVDAGARRRRSQRRLAEPGVPIQLGHHFLPSQR